MELRQINNLITGYTKKQQDLRSESWKQTRMLAYFFMLPYKKKEEKLNPEDLFSIPGEVVNSAQKKAKINHGKRATPEQSQRYSDLIKKLGITVVKAKA